LSQRSEQLAEAAGLVLGSQDEGGHNQVTGGVGHLVGKGAQRRGQALTLQAKRQGGDLGSDWQGGEGGRGHDGLLQPGRPGHGVSEHLGPPGHGFDASHPRLRAPGSTQ